MLSRLLISLLLLLFLTSSCVSGYSSSDIKSWCSQTPNPQPCEYGFLSNEAVRRKPIKSKSDFLKASMELALEDTQKGEQTTRSAGPKCRNHREKVAWADCLELYEQTILRLNKTLDPYSKHSQDDSETWLSTALTNLETCRTGFFELGTANYIWPLISNNNVTKLLSNCLALNYKGPSKGQNHGHEFPAWVKPRDRKLLQASSSPASQANVVVAKDGSGKFTSVKDAINAAPSSSGRYVIYVKAGVYNEQVEINKKNIMLIGDGIGKTIITGSKSVGGGTTTFRSATVAVVGDGFIARDITFRNTAGASNHQAVALRSGSDLSVFYRCGFEGYQDTLYVHSERQFYRECDIYGTVDFIFGNAAVVLQNCNIFARNPPQKVITVTAQGRTDPNQNTGIIIHNSKVTAASDLNPSSVQSYLGRPWQKYSRTVFMKTFLDSLINPAGWLPWSGNFALDTLYYAEYANTGPGSSTSNRVKWKGYHVLTSASQATPFTVANFIAGNSWLPATNVPFTSGL